MQFVFTPLPARTDGPGQQVAELPFAAPTAHCHLHTLAPGASVQWPPREPAPVLLLTEGLGKAALDGAALRVAAPCALRVPAATTLRICNQGSTPMRLLALRSSDCSGANAATVAAGAPADTS